MNCLEPRQMSFQSLEEEVVFLRRESKDQKKTIFEKENEIGKQNIQINLLTNTHTLATDILKASLPNATPKKQMWITKQVNEISQNLKNLISSISKDNLSEICSKMYAAAISICNFIYDHIGEIILYTSLIAAGAIILFDIAILVACVVNGAKFTSIAAPIAEGSIFIDFSLANAIV